MKIVLGYMYCGKDGKLHLYIYNPFATVPAFPKEFNGQEVDTHKDILSIRKIIDEDSIINKINWTYKNAAGNDIEETYSDIPSVGLYGDKPHDFSTMWTVLDESDLRATSNRHFARFAAEPIRKYRMLLTYLWDGQAMNATLGEVIDITDPAVHEINKSVMIMEMGIDPLNQTNEVVVEDATAITGKFMIACSEIDEGDGKGVTSSSYTNYWTQRFGYACKAVPGDPHYTATPYPGFDEEGNQNGVVDPDFGAQDQWGNGIEEPFIAF
jgi:hypothetical protein